MGINFRGVVASAKIYLTLIFATMHAVAICHENINPRNRLPFKPRNFNPSNLNTLTVHSLQTSYSINYNS